MSFIIEKTYGYIPNNLTPVSTANFRDQIAPWDENDRPPICDYSDFRKSVKAREAETHKLNENYCFWPHVIADRLAVPMWESNQGNLGSCTSFGVKNAGHCKMMLQLARNAEMRFDEYNPFQTFALSKDGSTRGGQSLSAIANAYNSHGAFSVADVGKYDAGTSGRSVFNLKNEVVENAKQRQIGFSEIDTKKYAAVEEVFFLSKNHVPCIIGNYNLIGKSKVDSNGVRVGVITGRGAHCTATGGAYRRKNGKEYVLYCQSWGDTFSGGDDALLPGFMTWLDRETLADFLNSSFLDIFAITYVEGFHERKSFEIPVVEYPEGMTYDS